MGFPIDARVGRFQMPDGRELASYDFTPNSKGFPLLLATGRGQHPMAYSWEAKLAADAGFNVKGFAWTHHGGSEPLREAVDTRRLQHIVSAQDQADQIHEAAKALFPGQRPLLRTQSMGGAWGTLYAQGALREGWNSPLICGHIGTGSMVEAYMKLGGIPIGNAVAGAVSSFMRSDLYATVTGVQNTLESATPNAARRFALALGNSQEVGRPSQTDDRDKYRTYVGFLLRHFHESTDEPTFGHLQAQLHARDLMLDADIAPRNAIPQLYIAGENDRINKNGMIKKLADRQGASEFVMIEGEDARHDFLLATDRIQREVLEHTVDFVKRHALQSKTGERLRAAQAQ